MNDLENMKNVLENLYKKYESNEFIRSKLNMIFENLEKTVEDAYNSHLQRIAKNEELSKEQMNFIQNFLNKNIYLFLNYEGKFFLYDNKNFTLYNYNDLLMDIYSSINTNNNDNLLKNKYSIENKIIKEIKTKSLYKAIPNSSTIQNTLKLFYPHIFPNKDTAKYFLLILGDCILKKQNNCQFIVSHHSKSYIDEMSNYIYNYLGISDILSCIKYKYKDESYENNRFIYVDVTDNYNEIKTNFIDIIVVACYYSNRYKSSELFLDTYCNKTIKKQITSLSVSIDDVLDKFFSEMLEFNDKELIHTNSIHFLWEYFIDIHKYPYVITEKQLYSKIHNKYKVSNSNVLSVNNKLLREVFSFIEFIKSNFEPSTENEQFEIDELIQIYKDNSGAIENLSNDIASKAILYYLKEIKIYEKKFFILKCKYWNKLIDVKNFIIDYKNNNEICTCYDAYEYYSNSKEYKYIANKYYFEYIYDDL